MDQFINIFSGHDNHLSLFLTQEPCIYLCRKGYTFLCLLDGEFKFGSERLFSGELAVHAGCPDVIPTSGRQPRGILVNVPAEFIEGPVDGLHLHYDCIVMHLSEEETEALKLYYETLSEDLLGNLVDVSTLHITRALVSRFLRVLEYSR